MSSVRICTRRLIVDRHADDVAVAHDVGHAGVAGLDVRAVDRQHVASGTPVERHVGEIHVGIETDDGAASLRRPCWSIVMSSAPATTWADVSASPGATTMPLPTSWPGAHESMITPTTALGGSGAHAVARDPPA